MKSIFISVSTIVLCFLGVVIGLTWSDSGTPLPQFDGSGAGKNSWVFLLTLSLTMFLGLYGSSLLDSLPYATSKKRPYQVNIRKAALIAAKSPTLVKAGIVSPIVFGAIYSTLAEQPDQVISYIVAFENGFFWSAILKSKSQIDS
jgi:hypothetical protein